MKRWVVNTFLQSYTFYSHFCNSIQLNSYLYGTLGQNKIPRKHTFKHFTAQQHVQKVTRGEVIIRATIQYVQWKYEELGKVHEQPANYQYRLVKAVGKSCIMRRWRVNTSAQVGRQSVRRFSIMENRFLSTYLLKLHHITLIVLCTDSNISDFTKYMQIIKPFSPKTNEFTQHLCHIIAHP